jgi:hypothetical protein
MVEHFSARTFFAFGYAHEPLGRFSVQHFAGVVTDHARFATAIFAVRLAGDHFFDAWQAFRQRLAARMRFAFARRR